MTRNGRRASLIGGLAIGALTLLTGPAGSLALGVDQATTELGSVAAAPAPAPVKPVVPAPRAGTTAPQRRAAPVTRPRPTRSASTTRSQPAPVDATVQGTNPHGQGTVLSVSVGGSEAVVVGRSRGEQKPDGSYHGHTTTLGLFGNDVIANDTGPGETAKGPLAPLQEQLLDEICKGSSGNLCVDLLRADSATTGTGSHNHSRLAGLMLGGESGLVAVAGDSNGNIDSNGDCQTAHGDVTLVKLMLGGNPLLDIGESASDSNACPGGTTTHNSENPLVAIGGEEVPLPGCGANSPGYLLDLSPLLAIACNAGSEAGAGGVVNDALAGTLLVNGDSPTGTLVAGGTGAAAQPPQQAVLGERESGGGDAEAGPQPSGGDDTSSSAGGGPRKTGTPDSAMRERPLTAETGGKLPYTGTNVLLALLLAFGLLAAGLTLRRWEADRRRSY